MAVRQMQQYELSFRVDWEDREILKAPLRPGALNSRLKNCYWGCGYQEEVPSTLQVVAEDKLIRSWYDEKTSMPSIRIFSRGGNTPVFIEWYGVYNSFLACRMGVAQPSPNPFDPNMEQLLTNLLRAEDFPIVEGTEPALVRGRL